MKALRVVGIGLLVIITSLVILSFLLPATAHVERSIVVKAAPEVVFDLVNDLENWEKWSPWIALDSNMELTYSPITKGKGASYSWKGNDAVGEGSLTITESTAPSSIKTDLNLGMGTSKGFWNFDPQQEEVVITWGMDADLSHPLIIGKFFGLVMDNMLGSDFEKGLANIKTLAESMPPPPTVEILKVTIAEPQWVLTIRDTIEADQLDKRRTALQEEVMTFMALKQLEANAAPLTFRHLSSKNEGQLIIESGIPVASEVEVSGRIQLVMIEAGEFATATHTGAYETLPLTYEAIESWIREHQLTTIGAPREVYITDPALESDQSKWYTQVFFRVR